MIVGDGKHVTFSIVPRFEENFSKILRAKNGSKYSQTLRPIAQLLQAEGLYFSNVPCAWKLFTRWSQSLRKLWSRQSSGSAKAAQTEILGSQVQVWMGLTMTEMPPKSGGFFV